MLPYYYNSKYEQTKLNESGVYFFYDSMTCFLPALNLPLDSFSIDF